MGKHSKNMLNGDRKNERRGASCGCGLYRSLESLGRTFVTLAGRYVTSPFSTFEENCERKAFT